MKRLAPELIRSIEDFVAESDLPLPAYALEKDFIVFDAIKLMAQMQPSPHFRLVFCGGTCLSKAYGILERMPEDVDFKLVPVHANLPGTSALRKQLSVYANSVVAALEAGGFGSEHITRRSLDGNRYTALDVRFASAFGSASLAFDAPAKLLRPVPA